MFDRLAHLIERQPIRGWIVSKISDYGNFEEAAEILGVSQGMIWDWTTRGDIPDNSGPLALNQRVLALTVAVPIIHNWVEFASRTDNYSDHLFASAIGGVNQGNVGIAGIMRGPIPLAPLDEILWIFELLEQSIKKSHSVQQSVEMQLQELGFANQSILAKAFRGELVPQDPNDEPASVLLEHIQAERADDTKSKPPRGRRKRSNSEVK